MCHETLLIIFFSNFFLFSLCVDVNQIFNFTNFFNFVTSSVVICVTEFLIIFSSDAVSIIRYSLTFITATMQLYLLAWTGDQMIESVGSHSVQKHFILFGN